TGGKLTATNFNYNGGALIVNGNLDPLSLTVCASCTLSGAGTVAVTNVTMHGTVQGGSSSTPGTLSINGDYSQASDGTLAVLLAGSGPGQVSVLSVSGTAALAGTVDFTA